MLTLLGLDLGGRADFDDGDAAGQLGETLLQLLTVVIGVGLLNLGANLVTRASTSALSPPPETMVVSSLETMTFLAVPSTDMSMESSLRPSSSDTT